MGKKGGVSDEVPQTTIIIGAGTAGLAAAEDLQKAHQDYIILEGRDRLGGRVHTQEWPRTHPTLFELGAAWFHDVPHNRLAYAAEEAGIEAGYDDDQTVIYDKKGKLDQNLVNELSSRFDAFRRQRDPNDPLEQVGTLFASHQDDEEHKRVALAVAHAYQISTGLKADQLSAHVEGPPGRDQAVQGGYIRVLNQIVGYNVDRSKIHYNKKVTHIVSPKEGDRVQVTTQDGTHYEGKAAIVTVPVGVLKSNLIQFNPGLGAHIQKALNHLEVATVNKVYLTFPSSFWSPTTYKFLISDESNPALIWNWDATHPGTQQKNTLAVIVTNDVALEIEKHPDLAFDIVKPYLEVIAHGDIPDATQVITSSWSGDEFSQGAFSTVPHGQTREEVAKPFEEGELRNRLVFAGEHATVEGAGLVQGAWLSGQRAAKQVIDHIQT